MFGSQFSFLLGDVWLWSSWQNHIRDASTSRYDWSITVDFTIEKCFKLVSTFFLTWFLITFRWRPQTSLMILNIQNLKPIKKIQILDPEQHQEHVRNVLLFNCLLSKIYIKLSENIMLKIHIYKWLFIQTVRHFNFNLLWFSAPETHLDQTDCGFTLRK